MNLIASRSKMHKKNPFLPIAAAVVLLGAIFSLRSRPVLLAIGDFLVIEDELQPGDLIHIIAGPDYRTDFAVRLYTLGYAKKIFFTGGWCKTEKLNHGEHGRDRAIEQGVSPQAIFIDDAPVHSTYDEALRLREFIKNGGAPIHSVIVVSDPYHMRRARWAYRQVLGNKMNLQMAPVPFGLSPYRHKWWTDENSSRMVREEYEKFAYYIARYRLAWGPVKEWLASLDRD
jgi:uncharacterized SAM-binding protein YcdF (DUF218 family)